MRRGPNTLRHIVQAVAEAPGRPPPNDHRLAATERSLTPWLDTVAAFCAGGHPELADPVVRARVVQCNHRGNYTRWWWGRRRQIVIDLDLRLRCPHPTDDDRPADDPVTGEDLEDTVGAQLVVRETPAGWRIVAARGCDE